MIFYLTFKYYVIIHLPVTENCDLYVLLCCVLTDCIFSNISSNKYS
jgi:hypothetical protein